MIVLKNLYSLYVHLIRPQRLKKIRFFFQLNNQTMMMMMMMMIMMLMMSCFCGMVDRRKTCSHISRRDHCQAGFEPAQNLSPGFDEWICAVMITTTPRRQVFNVGIRRWSVINLVTLILGYLYLIWLETVVSYRNLRSFQETKVNLSVLLHHVSVARLLIQNL